MKVPCSKHNVMSEANCSFVVVPKASVAGQQSEGFVIIYFFNSLYSFDWCVFVHFSSCDSGGFLFLFFSISRVVTLAFFPIKL